ncbi:MULTISPECIES: HU family DNA-binding protein [Paludibacter]|jgi:DNA-binding protein HU-beta|nr:MULTISPECIES: HU family DNA-binding protein [Paludibacter]MDP4201590.1 HU family DNA-binding protein [Bacteroidota bacterium]
MFYLCKQYLGFDPLFSNHFKTTSMNKGELVNAIAAEAGLTKADAKKALDATVGAITAALKGGDKVSLVGFGTFSIVQKEARKGINPATKKPIDIAAKKVAKFKAGAELAEAVQ